MREPRFYEEPSCAGVGGDFWFPEKGDGILYSKEMVIAQSICHQCPHKAECAEWGIKNEVHGIWGGLLPRQRQQMRTQLGITLREEDVA